MARILITGSRTWDNRDVIKEALQMHGTDEHTGLPVAVLVSGACPSGADQLAEEIWESWGGRVERHPAAWNVYGKRAGFMRNQEMVDLGADICLAFRKNESPGTTHCANAATMAGIPTIWYTEDDD